MQPVLVTLFTLLLVFSLGAWYVNLYHRRPKLYEESPSYLKRESLLLDYEQQYFRTLTKVVGGHARVFPKVRLSDLVQPQDVQPGQRAHWMRVQRRCVDFLLCSPNQLTPVLAIDLDTRVKRRKREQAPGGDVLDKALKTANIPLLRIRATRDYFPHEVLQQIRFALATSPGEPIPEWFGEPGKRGPRTRFLDNWLPTFSRVMRRA